MKTQLRNNVFYYLNRTKYFNIKILRDSYYTASDSSTCVAGLPGVRMVGAAEVIGLLVQNHRPSKNAVRSNNGKLLVDHVNPAGIILVEFHIAEIAHVAVFIARVTVLFLEYL